MRVLNTRKRVLYTKTLKYIQINVHTKVVEITLDNNKIHLNWENQRVNVNVHVYKFYLNNDGGFSF